MKIAQALTVLILLWNGDAFAGICVTRGITANETTTWDEDDRITGSNYPLCQDSCRL